VVSYPSAMTSSWMTRTLYLESTELLAPGKPVRLTQWRATNASRVDTAVLDLWLQRAGQPHLPLAFGHVLHSADCTRFNEVFEGIALGAADVLWGKASVAAVVFLDVELTEL
jgi:hypothetical protein